MNQTAPPAGVSLLPPIAFSPGLIVDVYFSSSQNNNNNNSNQHDQNHQSIIITNSTNSFNTMTQILHSINEKKRQVTEIYLHLIEETVDRFLCSPSVGVHLKAVSDRYLDEPPTNMPLIRRNADLLANLTQDSFNPHSELNAQLIAPLVQRVYTEFLDPLRQELYNFWMMKSSSSSSTRNPRQKNNNNNCDEGAGEFVKRYEPKLIELVEKRQQSHQNSNGDDVNELNLMKTLKKLVSKCHGVYQDIEHIDQMRELDGHSTAEIAEKFKGGGLSHVVPIAGLALGRIHRLLNEHNTVIQHWGSRTQQQQ
jgi:hypothetical protein